jgi:shikimate dehydrogenase
MSYIEIYEIDNNPAPGKIQVCGIIGDPIEHSVSPAMQNAAFQRKDMKFVYVPFKVKE